jgi:N-acetylglutamate synthase-like GNAT family acetyltransferase
MARYFILFLGVLSQGIGSLGFQFRSAMDEDISAARKILLQQAMNPLSLSKENLLVAFDDDLDEQPLLGFGQIRPMDNDYSELASLYVIPKRRKQGIGGAIVEALLERHKASSSKEVCLLTLKPTVPFYETYGFQVASESERKKLPASLQFEFQAGNAVSLFLGNALVCMIQK